jgi:4-amino-4-deoxy-L-arabinose transferase-like glycosyltransferase
MDDFPKTRDWRQVGPLAVLVLYGLGLALFPPTVALISDEAQYIRQAVAYASGERRVPARGPEGWEEKLQLPSDYPPATSLLQTPFVRLGGWRGAAWASFLALAILVFLTASWLGRRGLPGSYAALVPLFLPAAVLARTGMSDLPSAAVVVGALWLLDKYPSRTAALGGGFLAGASVAFRDSNPIFLVFALLGCMRRRGPLPLLAAAAALGASTRFLLAWALQGNALMLRYRYPFTFEDAGIRALLYAFALLVLVPGGLAAALAYRGRKRGELLGTVLLPFTFFTLYSYSGRDSGVLSSIVLGPRYLLPLVPLLALAIAQFLEARVASPRLKTNLERSLVLAAAALSFAVHPLMQHWSRHQAALVEALYGATDSRTLLVTEPGATAKYLNGLYGARTWADKRWVPPDEIVAHRAHGPVQLVFIERDDSDYWRLMARRNQKYVDDVSARCELQTRVDQTNGDRLRILDVRRCE